MFSVSATQAEGRASACPGRAEARPSICGTVGDKQRLLPESFNRASSKPANAGRMPRASQLQRGTTSAVSSHEMECEEVEVTGGLDDCIPAPVTFWQKMGSRLVVIVALFGPAAA